MTQTELKANLRSDIRALRQLQGRIERGLAQLGYHAELSRCRGHWAELDRQMAEALGDGRDRVHSARRDSTRQ